MHAWVKGKKTVLFQVIYMAAIISPYYPKVR